MATKELTIVGGANGVGKTTFAIRYASYRECMYLGADAIAAELAPDSPELIPVRAGLELMRRLNVALAGEEPFVLESTLAGQTLRRTIRDAHATGFSIKIVYLFLDSSDLCVQRVQERVHKGGHFVPESDVRRRFRRSLHNFWQKYRHLADRWLLVYNSKTEPIEVAEGSADGVMIRNAELYTLFSRLIQGTGDV